MPRAREEGASRRCLSPRAAACRPRRARPGPPARARSLIPGDPQYAELQKPLYERRRAIITGEAKPTPEEIKAGEEEEKKEDPDYTPLPAAAGENDTAAIPEFWLTALRNHPALGEMITDRDADALKSLVDISISYLPPKEKQPGFKIAFHFKENEFFKNTVLEKTYLYQEEVGYEGDFVYDRAIGTTIEWKEDKDLTKTFEIKKQRNKSKCTLVWRGGEMLIVAIGQTRTAPVSSARRSPPSRSSTSSRHRCPHLRRLSRAATLTRTSSRRLKSSSRSTTRSARI